MQRRRFGHALVVVVLDQDGAHRRDRLLVLVRRRGVLRTPRTQRTRRVSCDAPTEAQPDHPLIPHTAAPAGGMQGIPAASRRTM